MQKKIVEQKKPILRRGNGVARVPKTVSSNPDNGIPMRRVVTLAYGGTHELDGGANAYAGNVYRMNSMYDPDATGAGHQPRGFDQLVAAAGPYTKFTVTKCEVTAVFRNLTADCVYVGLYATNVVSNPVDMDSVGNVLEMSNIVWKLLMPTTQAGQSAIVTNVYDVAKFMGRPNILYDEDCAGSYTANPTFQTYVMAFALGRLVAVDCSCDVQLKYTAVLHGRNTPAFS
jgi:hypothetical protein